MTYGTLAGSKTYHADRGNAAWAAGDDADLTTALLRGAEYIDGLYRGAFPGYKVGARAQVREWPRYAAYDNEGNTIATDVAPDEVVYAAYEAALLELATPGTLSPVVTQTDQVKREVIVGAVEVEYVGASGVSAARPVVTKIDAIISPVLTSSAGSFAGTMTRG
jgi:hypothetical protein